ncbi:MAG: thioredoxin-disulfide reductase [Candidatus Margulisiibacteriota bacterium]|nr:MAG: thioredoxin-disulfide reductase [Candidatus Margulisiibacteriota bacterium]
MIKEISEKDYDELVFCSKGPVIVDFYSTECPPCEALAPKFQFFAEKYVNEIKFYKIFRQGNRDLSRQLGVKGSPTILFYNNGEELGKRLSGAIKKSEINSSILNLYGLQDKSQGIKREELHCNVAIIGAGPAGLTAALYAANAKLSTVVIDKGNTGGTVNITHSVSNYPGTGSSMQGFMLMHNMTEQVKAFQATIMTAVDITGINLNDKIIYIDDDKVIRADSIILDTGSNPRPLNIPGEKEFSGKGISYCATCDGSFYEGKNVFVVGGGNSAIEEALYLARFVNKLTVIHQFDEFQANKVAVDELLSHPKISVLWSHEPRAFLGNASYERVEVEDLKTGKKRILDDAEGVFVFVGYVPQTDLFKNTLALDNYGYVFSSEHMETNIPGVFVAGDVRQKRYRQITTAVSDGTIAALAAGEYLKQLSRSGTKDLIKVVR